MPVPPPQSIRLLQILRKRSSAGFEVMSQLGITTGQQLADILDPLVEQGLVRVTGDTNTNSEILDAVFSIPLNKKAEAEVLLQYNRPRIRVLAP